MQAPDFLPRSFPFQKINSPDALEAAISQTAEGLQPGRRMPDKRQNRLAACKAACYNQRVGRQALPVESSLATAYRSEGGDRMTDYEMLMIVLTVLTLLVMASKRSDR
ncbi:MAG: hypothetical protein SOZ79_06250 [Candidatus Ventricola sp.]|nr:hypothetical protein [Candidatus Ventricola sp.]